MLEVYKLSNQSLYSLHYGMGSILLLMNLTCNGRVPWDGVHSSFDESQLLWYGRVPLGKPNELTKNLDTSI